ncbi:MAG: ABC transporter permease [Alphaproteobacteria bacterium]
MFRFILQRILATIPVMFVVAIFIFLMLRLSPGDPATVIAGDYATPEAVARIRANLGLDEPLPVQFMNWIVSLLRGDLGISIFSNMPVTTLIAQRLEPTVALACTTLALILLVAVPLGTIAAWKANTWIDRTIMIGAVLGFSIPVFVLAYVFIYVFAIRLGWLPVQGYVSPARDLVGFARHMVLPTVALSGFLIALIARMTRASVREVLDEDYIRTAHAKGLTERAVLMRHALRNAAVPIVTMIGIAVAILLGGVVVTESVFNIPGLGRLVVDAILKRDYPIIQGLIIVFSFVYIVINLIVDVIYTALDPRIRY